MNFMKRLVIILITIIVVSAGCKNGTSKTITGNEKVEKSAVVKSEASDAKTIHLTNDTFKEKVFNYEVNKEWEYEGNKPCIIDFYADWCGPCKKVAPILEELAKEYDGKIIIYKVNTEKQKELAGAFGIRSIPSLLFVPVTGQPQMAQGALPKEQFEKIINEFLLVKAE